MNSFKSLLLELAFKSNDLKLYDDTEIGSSHEVKQYKDKQGHIFYVKTPSEFLYEYYTDPIIHILVEYLAYEIYRMYNIKVPFVDLYIHNNKIMLASKESKGTHVDFKDLPKYKDFVTGFAVDCFIANWDVSGTSAATANLLMDEHGNVTRIDPGGSLTFRARGGKKREAFDSEVKEVDTMRNPHLSVSAISYNTHKDIILQSFKNFLNISWSSVKTNLINFNKNNIIKPITDLISDSQLKENIIDDWNIEFAAIINKLSERHSKMYDIYRRLQSE